MWGIGIPFTYRTSGDTIPINHLDQFYDSIVYPALNDATLDDHSILTDMR